jgi:hypothetical protein
MFEHTHLIAISLDLHSTSDTDECLTMFRASQNRTIVLKAIPRSSAKPSRTDRMPTQDFPHENANSPAGDISDVEECIVERSEDVSDGEDVLSLADLKDGNKRYEERTLIL